MNSFNNVNSNVPQQQVGLHKEQKNHAMIAGAVGATAIGVGSILGYRNIAKRLAK